MVTGAKGEKNDSDNQWAKGLRKTSATSNMRYSSQLLGDEVTVLRRLIPSVTPLPAAEDDFGLGLKSTVRHTDLMRGGATWSYNSTETRRWVKFFMITILRW